MRTADNLDFATSGVLIAAKSHLAAADVSRCFRDRLARTVYCALVFGHPSWEATQWDDRIMENGRRFKQRISGGGKAAQTDVVVGARGVLRVGQHAGREASLLWLFPHTGRRHQLRLHCSHHQHAIDWRLGRVSDCGTLSRRAACRAAWQGLRWQNLPPCWTRSPQLVQALGSFALLARLVGA